MKISINCVVCGKVFGRWPGYIQKRGRKHSLHCSNECREESKRRKRKTRICGNCGASFECNPSQLNAQNRKFCDRRCWFNFRRRGWNRKDLREFLFANRIIDEVTGCWLYVRGKGPYSGDYGMVKIDGIPIGVHKVSAWIFHKNSQAVRKGRNINVCHTCDVRRCFNPDHLVVATPKFNSEDAVRKGRHPGQLKTHCKRGHPLSGINLIVKKTNHGQGWQRVCRTCRRCKWRDQPGVQRGDGGERL